MPVRSTFSSASGPPLTGIRRESTVRHFDEAHAGRYTPRQSAVRRGASTNGRTGSTVRKELHDYVGGLRFQLGAEERHLAANVWAGMLRDRDDRFDDLAVRYGQVWSGSVPAVAATGRPDDRGGHGDAEDGAGAETCVGADAGPEVVHFDGSMLQRGRTV